LVAELLVIGGEDPSDFERLREELLREHSPKSTLECELVERLAGLSWRLRRIPFFEAAILDARQAQVADEARYEELGRWPDADDELQENEEMTREEWSVHIGRALIKDGTWNDALGKLARHEATLMAAFTKTLQMLLLLRDNRNDSDPKMIEARPISPKEH
jgi:hypothetical protein